MSLPAKNSSVDADTLSGDGCPPDGRPLPHSSSASASAKTQQDPWSEFNDPGRKELIAELAKLTESNNNNIAHLRGFLWLADMDRLENVVEISRGDPGFLCRSLDRSKTSKALEVFMKISIVPCISRATTSENNSLGDNDAQTCPCGCLPKLSEDLWDILRIFFSQERVDLWKKALDAHHDVCSK